MKVRKILIFLSIICGVLVLGKIGANAQVTQCIGDSTSQLVHSQRTIVKDKNGNYYIAYTKQYNGYNHIFVLKSDNAGASFKIWNGTSFVTQGTETEVPIESTGSYSQNSPAIAVDNNNNIHVAWSGTSAASATYNQIRYVEYNGTSWVSLQDITSENYNQSSPSIEIYGNNNIYLVWYGCSTSSTTYTQIRYSMYTTSWSSPSDVTSENYNQSNPQLIADNSNNIHLVWQGASASYTAKSQIRYSKYTTGWVTPVNITTDNNYAQSNPSISLDNQDNVYVVWAGKNSSSTTYSQIQYSKYTTSWTNPVNITSGNYNQDNPSIYAWNPNNIYVAWNGTSGTSATYNQIRYSKYTTSWSTPTNITSGNYNQTMSSYMKNEPSFIWMGVTNSGGASTSANGVMFYNVVAPSPTIPVISDVGDNEDGRDIQVTFNGAINENNINEYRIYAVASGQVAAFDETIASNLDNSMYVSVAKTGNSAVHALTLPQTLYDTVGNPIANGEAYKIYILSVGANGFLNYLSCANGYLTLTSPPIWKQYDKIRTKANTGSKLSLAKDNFGNYYYVYSSSFNGFINVFVRKSEDEGITWKHWNGTTFSLTGQEMPIAQESYDQNNPAIAIDNNGTIHIVWYGKSATSTTYKQIRYIKYTNGIWSFPTDITSESNEQFSPWITVDNSNNIHVAWYGYSASSASYTQIRYKKYTTSWSDITNISWGNYDQKYVSMEVDENNNIHLIWKGTSAAYPAFYQIRYSKYTDSWSAPVDLTSDSYDFDLQGYEAPWVAVDSSNNIYVVWAGKNAASQTYSQIQYLKYTGNWSTPVNITSESYDQKNPSIAVDKNNRVHVVWHGKDASSTSYEQIRYSKYTTLWSSPVDITSGSYSQANPAITKKAYGFMWVGTTTNAGESISSIGAMFYPLTVPKAANAYISDIADNGDGRDIQVGFDGASNETNISEYRIFVVPSKKAEEFNEVIATGLTGERYVLEAKTGNNSNHSLILSQALLDSEGNAIVNGQSYQVFVMAVGQNDYNNSLSLSSNGIMLAVPTSNISVVTSDQTAFLQNANQKSLVKDSLGNYYAAYSGDCEGNNHIFVRKSEDTGVTWKYWNGSSFDYAGNEVPIESLGSYNQLSPSLAVDNLDNLHLVWYGTDSSSPTYTQIKYSEFTGIWSTPINLTNGSYNQANSTIAIDGNDNIFVLWSGYTAASPTKQQIIYSKYNGSWSGALNITADNNYEQNNPSIIVDGGNNIHAVWSGQNAANPSNSQIRYSVYSMGSWSAITEITSEGYEQLCPNIEVSSDNKIYVLWYGKSAASTTYNQIRYAIYNGSWGVAADLTSENYDQANVSVGVDDSNNVYAFWEGSSGSSPVYKQIRCSSYAGSWTTVIDKTSGNNNQGFPIIMKGSVGYIWNGLTNLSGTSSSSYGIMYSKITINPMMTSTPIASDIADNGDGRDIQVVFNAASDETNISEYRVYVVPSAQASGFDADTAAGLDSTRYVSESITGNGTLHTITLTGTLKDSIDAAITNGATYKLFILSVGQNGYSNVLCFGSSDLTLTIPAPITSTPTATDIGDNGDGRDIRVTFNGASNETNISGYRIYVVQAAAAGSFNAAIANGLTSSRYVSEAVAGNGAGHTVTLTQQLLDTSGTSIVNGTSYKIFVLSVGINGYINSLSGGSNDLTLQSPPTAITLFATNDEVRQSTLTWAGGIGATSFEVFRDTVSQGTHTSGWVDASLDNGTTYSYYVVASNGLGSVTSNTVNVTTMALPTEPTITMTPNTWTNGNVAVTVTGGTGAAKYKIGEGSWSSYSTVISRSDNTTVYAKTVNAAGDSLVVSIIPQIDKVKPLLPSISVDTNWTSAASITITITDGTDGESGFNRTEYSLSGATILAWTTYSGAFNITNAGQTTITARTIDNAGNISDADVKIVKIDRTNPSAPSITADTAWTSAASVNATITGGTDGESGVNRTEYSLDGVNWTTYSGAFDITNAGQTTISAITIDNVGNVSPVTTKIVQIDRTNPSAPNITVNTDWTKAASVSAIISGGTDGESGINRIEYSLNGVDWTTYTETFDITNAGQTTISARAVDNVGNVSSAVTKIVKIDRTSPSVPSIIVNTAWTNAANVSATIADGTDEESGINRTEYSLDGVNWTTYTGAFDVTNEGQTTIIAKTIDNADNTSDTDTKIVKIDRTNPSFTLSQYPTEPTNGYVTITANINDDASGISVKKWAAGICTADYFASAGTTFSAITFDVSDNGDYTVYAEDNAGNKVVNTITISNFDFTMPATPTFSADINTPTPGPVTVAISYSGDSQEKKYSSDGVIYLDYADPIAMNSNGTIYAKGKNAAGTWSSVGVCNIINIDAATPQIMLTPSTTAVTESAITITVDVSDAGGVAARKYEVGNQTASYFAAGGIDLVGNPSIFTANASGTYTVYARDNAGNETVEHITITNIQEIPPDPPVISVSSGSPTKDPITVTINYSLDSVVKQYKIGAGEYQDYIGEFTINDNTIIYAKAQDEKGHISNEVDYVVDNIDNAPPTGTLTINSGQATTSSSTVTLNITGVDLLSNVDQMIISNNADFTDAVWEPYANSKSWTLTSQDGIKTIYIKFKDALGNESITYTGTITMQTQQNIIAAPIFIPPVPEEEPKEEETEETPESVADKLLEILEDDSETDFRKTIENIKNALGDFLVIDVKAETKNNILEVYVPKDEFEKKIKNVEKVNELLEAKIKSEYLKKLLEKELTKITIRTDKTQKNAKYMLPIQSLVNSKLNIKLDMNDLVMPASALKNSQIEQALKLNSGATLELQISKSIKRTVSLNKMSASTNANFAMTPNSITQSIQLNMYINNNGKKVKLKKLSDKITFKINVEKEFTPIDAQKLGVYSQNGTFYRGRYNSQTKEIEFNTKSTGIYKVIKENIIFKDLDDNINKDYVEILAAKHITDGVSPGMFRPKMTLTRAQVATFITRVLDIEPIKYKGAFTDVPQNQWYTAPIESIAEVGLIEGVGNNKFEPEREITNEELITIIMRAYYYLTGETETESKIELESAANASEYAKTKLKAAYLKGIMDETDDKNIIPKGKVNREETAKFIVRFLNSVE